MKRLLNKMLVFTILLFVVFLFQSSPVRADIISSTSITLDNYTKSIAFDFIMPKDGTVKINIKVKDLEKVPGALNFALQTDYSNTSTRITEVSGITSTEGVTDLEVDLDKGEYYLYYELNDPSDSELFVHCEVEMLPSIAVNVSKLTTHNLSSLEDISLEGYEELQFGDGDTKLILPFTVKQAGGLIISIADKSGNYQSVTARIYEDEKCKKPVGNSFSAYSLYNTVNIVRSLPKKGTYYIKLNLDESDPGITSFKIKLHTISNTSRTLAHNSTTVAYQDKEGTKITYKIVVKNTSHIALTLKTYNDSEKETASFQLLDSKKKKISKNSIMGRKAKKDGSYLNIQKTYTVNKGTYYIQVDTNSGVYQLNNIVKKAVGQAGNSKAKAKLIKIGGKSVEGYLTAFDKTTKAEWYKFTVSKNQSVLLNLVYFLDGAFKYSILDSKGKEIWSNDNSQIEEGVINTMYGFKFTKGTYYIKINKANSTSSCTYILSLYEL